MLSLVEAIDRQVCQVCEKPILELPDGPGKDSIFFEKDKCFGHMSCVKNHIYQTLAGQHDPDQNDGLKEMIIDPNKQIMLVFTVGDIREMIKDLPSSMRVMMGDSRTFSNPVFAIEKDEPNGNYTLEIRKT